jgi:hypothetical protein
LPNPSGHSAGVSSDLTRWLGAINRQQASTACTQVDADSSMQALDAVAVELRRMIGEQEKAATALGDVSNELQENLEGDIPHNL